MSIAASLVVQLPGLAVTVRELTVAEVRAMILEGGRRLDPFHAMLFEDFSLADLARMSDAGANQLEVFAPSELAPLISAARLLNPEFFNCASLHNSQAITVAELDRICCNLAVIGHADVWRYPWKTYLTAVKVANGGK